ncbi:hypothetical protein BKD30_13235 [Tersicoccus phoenicis]|uniref:Uncharacterized protein n=2 Tax=Tersicoccus phoenicis TaxID=554083 RepID=A0A1R1L6Y3_9MICC|nr:hypothetical protein BKD30_13235 [Tersicoccus phoenicis]
MLGGRYKVTGQVLVSVDADYVFDGVDQILSRKVSILVPAGEHAEDMVHHARQVAVGERSDPLQVLDLGYTEDHRYVVTNRASAAELLDLLLVEERAEPDDADSARPFDHERTDRDAAHTTVGAPTQSRPIAGYRPEDRDEDDRALESEIFDGSAWEDRSEHDRSEGDGATHDRRPGRWGLGRFGAGAAAGAAAGVLTSHGRGAAPEAERDDSSDAVDTTSFDAIDDRTSGYGDDDGTRWDEPSRDDDLEEDQVRDEQHGGRIEGVAAGGAVAAGTSSDGGRTDDDDLEEDDRENDPRFSRALVGVLVVALILAGAFFVYTQLGQLAGGGGTPAAQSTPSGGPASSAAASPSGSATSSSPATPSTPPRVVGVTRETKNNRYPGVASLDRLLPRLVDGNQATDWISPTYSSANFAGLADNLALVVGLQDPAKVSRVDITQQGGQGGNFQLMVNDSPTIDGARQVAQGSFTSPNVSVPLPGGTPAGKYLIINFTELPRITGGQYPYGLRISEIALT